jgi:hypothetical protein
MIAETVILLAPYLPLPPTWINDPADETMSWMLPAYNSPGITPTLTPFVTQTAECSSNLSLVAPRALVALESPAEARRSAAIALANRVSALRTDISNDTDANHSARFGQAFEYVLNIIDAIPTKIPLPRPMLLSEQVSLFWDYGGIYVEIDVSPDGMVSAYGKHPTKPEMFLDTDIDALTASGGMFPKSLEDFLLPA